MFTLYIIVGTSTWSINFHTPSGGYWIIVIVTNIIHNLNWWRRLKFYSRLCYNCCRVVIDSKFLYTHLITWIFLLFIPPFFCYISIVLLSTVNKRIDEWGWKFTLSGAAFFYSFLIDGKFMNTHFYYSKDNGSPA